MSEQNVEQIMQALTRAPDPACEVITIERAGAETILRHLEDTNALPEHVAFLRGQLAEPKIELWAVHSVGPGEVYPSLSKEHAEREAQELIDLGRKMKAERIERGESVEHWHDWVVNVIPSPWEPAEHFQILAEETIEHRDSLLASIEEPASSCDHQWTDDGLHLMVCTVCGAQEDHDPHWRDMATAPRDGTMVRLLVDFTEHATEDADQAPTIGANNFDNDGEDRWLFAGWCWSHDHFTQGEGEPIGWLPMLNDPIFTPPKGGDGEAEHG